MWLSACFLLHIWALADLNNEEQNHAPKSQQPCAQKTWRKSLRLMVLKALNTMHDTVQGWDTSHLNGKRLGSSVKAAKDCDRKHQARGRRRRQIPGMGCTLALLTMCATAAMSTTGAYGDPTKEHVMKFDTDSKRIGVDNRASACMSHDINDFEGPLEPVNMHVQGFGGHEIRNAMRGTIKWSWLDDQGRPSTFHIPRSFHVPEGKARLLSPQHWVKTQKDPVEEGTGEFASAKKCTLKWNGQQNVLTMPLGKNDDVATMHMAPGYQGFAAFCAKAGADHDEEQSNPLTCKDAGITSDNEDDEARKPEAKSVFRECFKMPKRLAGSKRKNDQIDGVTVCEDGVPISEGAAPIETEFDLNTRSCADARTPDVVPDEEDRQKMTSTAELLMHHHRFGHVSFEKLQIMARQGMLPTRLANCNEPACSACLHGKATHRSKGTKQRKDCKPQKAAKLGEIASVDMMVSPTPGLVAQKTGKLTTKRCKHATMFIDNCSRLSHTHLQKSSAADETIEAKKAFELHACQHGVEALRYHADNGTFRANKWVAECDKAKQSLTFAGANAHQANGHAEAQIRRLQELARTMLMHATKRWPGSVTINLWPCAKRMANDAINKTPSSQDEKRRAPLQIFAKTEANTNPKHWKMFGSPTFALKEPLQRAGATFHKWKDHSKIGTCSGRSPQHSQNVALALDRMTGLVSPQFHAVFDPAFGMVRDEKFKSTWQTQAGFVNEDPKVRKPQNQGNIKQNSKQNAFATTSKRKHKGCRHDQANKDHESHKLKQHAPQRAHIEGNVGKLQQSTDTVEMNNNTSPTKIPEPQDNGTNDVGTTPVHMHK